MLIHSKGKDKLYKTDFDGILKESNKVGESNE